MTTKLRWGVLGCGNIARAAIAPAIRWSNNGTLAAIGSRSRETAARLAGVLGVARAHGSYEALLADHEVDAVYIGLPNGLHTEWCLRAAEAGKHVLCEKSLALSRDDARRVTEVFRSKGLCLVEAFMYRHHPQWSVVRDALGSIGDVKYLRTSLSGMLSNARDHRWSATLGGGALFDVSCYGVNVARFVLGREPLRVSGLAELRGEVDVTTAATLEFAGGALASVCGSLGAAPEQSLVIVGTRGRIVVERPFIPEWSSTTVTVNERVVEVAGANHFLHQMEHFASYVAGGPVGPAEDGERNVAVCAAIAESIGLGRRVDLSTSFAPQSAASASTETSDAASVPASNPTHSRTSTDA